MATAHGHSHAQPASFELSTGEGVRVLRLGVALLLLTTLLQVVLLLLSGSVSLLGDTLHNGVDVAATGVVWFAFLLSRRARSERFNFGFHRFEDIAGLAVVVLIAASAGLVIWEAANAFGGDGTVQRPWVVLVAGVVGFAGNELVAQLKLRTGRRLNSAALVADGQHSRVDGLTSLGVVVAAIGLLLNADWLDAAVGLGIGAVIAWTAYETGKEVVLRLLDSADPAMRDELLHLTEHVEGVAHVSDLRIRTSGRVVQVVAHVCVSADLPFRRAHAVAEELRGAWLRVLPPGSSADIHVDPFTDDTLVPHPADRDAAPTAGHR